ncbi:MAG: hypothetical protein SFU98_07500 [Leptospiraceae bacterium]|nr:hypothetical protein [Leptospiraceae bacterium]
MNKIIETSLGVNLYNNGNRWEIDLTHLRIFTGLSVLARVIGDQIIDTVESGVGDVSFIYKINPNINPQLPEMQINYIQIYAKSGVLDDIMLFKDEFHEHLRSVFGTFQRPVWGKKIHPEFFGENSREVSSAILVFPFHHISPNDDVDYQFVLERGENLRNPGKFFFRLTIENFKDSLITASKKPFLIVDDLKSRVFIAGSTKMSESLNEKLKAACKKGMNSFSEENLVYGHLFEQVSKTLIGDIDQLNFFWEKEFSEFMLSSDKTDRLVLLKRIFLTLEDNEICKLLVSGQEISISHGKFTINVYLTRMCRVLNFSINKDRILLTPSFYLDRMPLVKKLTLRDDRPFDFTGIRIFLIHHITSEILALIEAFRRLNVEELQVMFVKYGGVVPNVYLDILLEINQMNFFSTGLYRTQDEFRRDYYLLSRAYSTIDNYNELNSYLEKKKWNFYDAMKFISGHFFLKFAFRAIKDGKKVLLVEDGGYLAPNWHDYAIKNVTLDDVCKEFLVDNLLSDSLTYGEFMDKFLIGTVEHTRNGYDRLLKVKQAHGKLYCTSYSIAISHNKVVEESKEVAHSILSSIESILHGQGMVLSRRKMIVLGAAGNIGGFLSQYLIHGRLHETNKDLIQIDLKFDNSIKNQYIKLSDIPESDFLDLELFIGVIGESILKNDFIEKLLIQGKKEKLIFASGSTKTVEFADLTLFLNGLFSMKEQKIKNIPVKTRFERIVDPQSQIDQGGKVTIEFLDGSHNVKILYLLSDLSPINFLFYGVPTETMDMIISNLASVSLGMVDQMKKDKILPSNLYAVDHEIDRWGELR